jgi:hypothetical protein
VEAEQKLVVAAGVTEQPVITSVPTMLHEVVAELVKQEKLVLVAVWSVQPEEDTELLGSG